MNFDIFNKVIFLFGGVRHTINSAVFIVVLAVSEYLSLASLIIIVNVLTGVDDRILSLFERLPFSTNAYINDLEMLVIISSCMLYCFAILLRTFCMAEVIKFTSNTRSNLSAILFGGFIYENASKISSRSVADAQKIAITDVDHFVQTLLRPVVILIKDVIFIAIIIVSIVFIQPSILVVLVFLGCATVIVTKLTAKRIIEISSVRNKLEENRHKLLSDGIRGTFDIISNRYQRYFYENYFDSVKKTSQNVEQVQFLRFISTTAYEILIFFSIVGLVIGVKYYFDPTFNIGQTLVLLVILIMRLRPSFQNITGSITSLRYGLSNLDNLYRLCKTSLSLISDNDGVVSSETKGFYAVQVKTHGYSKADILEDVSFTISHGDKICVTGPSGSGKSTLMKFVAGLEDNVLGTVKILQTSKKVDNTKKVADFITYLPQDPYVFHGTVEENIAGFSELSQSQSKALEELKQLDWLQDAVSSMPSGFQSYLVPGGSGLSGGQVQRICLARTLFNMKENTILILDESTSALDSNLEKRIVEFLTSKSNLTLLMITHSKYIDKFFTKQISL